MTVFADPVAGFAFDVEDFLRAGDDPWVGVIDYVVVFAVVGKQVEDVANGVDARPHLVVGFDDVPGGEIGVGVVEHRRLGGGVLVPAVIRREIDWAELPLFQRVALAAFESSFLLDATYGKVELDDSDAGICPHLLNQRGVY